YAAQVEISSCENTSPGVVLDVYTGDFVGWLPRVAHETLSCENGTRIRFKTIADRTYRIAVAGADTEGGAFTLEWDLAPVVLVASPANNTLVPPFTTQFPFEGTTIGDPTEVRWRRGEDGDWNATDSIGA